MTCLLTVAPDRGLVLQNLGEKSLELSRAHMGNCETTTPLLSFPSSLPVDSQLVGEVPHGVETG